jgi:hypothetical protein
MLRLVKWFLIIAGIILVAIFIATRILNNQIQQKLEAKGINVENISLNLFSRSGSLENIAYKKGADSIHIDYLTVSSFRVLKFITRSKLELGEVTILNPYVIRTIQTDSVPVSKPSTPTLEEILVHTLTISHLNLTLAGKTQLNTIADIELIDFTLTRELFPSIKSVNALIENLSYTPKDSLHTIEVRSLSLNSTTDSLRIDSLTVTPNYSKAAFGKKAGFQKDRLEISIPLLLASGISKSSLKDSLISISRIEIPSSEVATYRDKRQPFNENQRKDVPGELLRTLPIGLIIDSILIKNSNIVYEEQPEDSDKTFELSFTSLHASMSGINTTSTSGEKYATLLATSKFMKDGVIDAKFQIPLVARLPHTANGTVTNLDLTSLNPILSNVGRITIEKGFLQELQFSFVYDNYRSKGDVDLTYKEFKLKVSKASDPHKSETLSTLINLVINNDKVQTKHGLIDIERDPKRFVFQQWWKAISNGIKNSINPLKSDKRKQ